MDEGAAFHDLAVRYCALVDAAPEDDRAGFVDRAAICLCELYRLASQLRDAEPGSDSPIPLAMTDEEARVMERRLAAVLGDWNDYWEVYDPTEMPAGEPVVGSLADDLSDIYRDLRDGILLWQQGRHEDARWEWRIGFRSHWGAHLVDALRAIHWRRQGIDVSS